MTFGRPTYVDKISAPTYCHHPCYRLVAKLIPIPGRKIPIRSQFEITRGIQFGHQPVHSTVIGVLFLVKSRGCWLIRLYPGSFQGPTLESVRSQTVIKSSIISLTYDGEGSDCAAVVERFRKCPDKLAGVMKARQQSKSVSITLYIYTYR